MPLQVSVTSTKLDRAMQRKPVHHFFGSIDHPSGVCTFPEGMSLNVRDGERNYRINFDADTVELIWRSIERQRRK